MSLVKCILKRERLNVRLSSALMVLGILCGSAHAAVKCTVTPEYAILSEGEVASLSAKCDKPLSSLQWYLSTQVDATDKVAITSLVNLNQPNTDDASPAIQFITPVLLQQGAYYVHAEGEGIGANGAVTSSKSMLKVEPAAVQATTNPDTGNSTTTLTNSRQNGECKSGVNGVAQLTMPSVMCKTGVPRLTVETSQGFSWTCASQNGGTEQSCYAPRGYKVTTQLLTGNGTLGTTPLEQVVEAGKPATITVSPDSAQYTAVISSADSPACGGVQSGNNFTTEAINKACTIKVSFSDSVAGSCGVWKNNNKTLTALTAGVCAAGTVPVNSFGYTESTGVYAWTCAGINSQTNDSCSAKRYYTVTPVAPATGNLQLSAPIGGEVAHGATASFSITTPADDQMPVIRNQTGDCTVGASPTGSGTTYTYTTGAIGTPPNGVSCTVAVSFVQASNCSGVSIAPWTTHQIVPRTVVPATSGFSGSFNAPGSGFSGYLDPNVVESYAFSNDRSLTNNNVSVVGYTAGKITMAAGTINNAKDISISECPGDYRDFNSTLNTGVPSVCKKLGGAGTSLYWSKDGRVINILPSCKLDEGKIYYINLRSSARTTPAGFVLTNYVTTTF